MTSTPKGVALTIGLNSIDPAHYYDSTGQLTACEADAAAMSQIAASQGYTVKALLTKDATRARVMAEIRSASTSLVAGDIFLLTYSGHGGLLPDLNDDEPDGQDQTWCLYDGQMVDDELYALFGEFVPGVRIFVLSDSCHSGSVTKELDYKEKLDIANSNVDSDGVRYRFLPTNLAFSVYSENRTFYDPILENPLLNEAERTVKASVLLISGCQDNQLSADGVFNGRFTGQLLRVWKHGAFSGDYRDFQEEIVKRMPKDQTPNYFFVGSPNPRFESQLPFRIT